MTAAALEQTSTGDERLLQIGVDVGGTFTDLVAYDAVSGALRVVKLPSTPPEFDRAVVEAVGRTIGSARARVVHGSTVATNALLQRAGAQVAFVTTEGFRDMLLIGRQNRPRLYALHVQRPAPLTAAENWFTVRERIAPDGQVVEPLETSEMERVLEQICARHLKHVAVCLLFSFVNPSHERLLGRLLEQAGLTVSLSCDVLPEFREYERASTTVINASLRPTVQQYLRSLEEGLPPAVRELRIMHSGGGTLAPAQAAASAAKLVLSGPAGGVCGASLVAEAAGFRDVITYDMGGTSTDVATIIDGKPRWTTSSTIDGLPIGLPAFDIHTVGAGGGSIAYLDPGGALRVGPRSAGAVPGPACYGRGGIEPTVTDANLLLGRLIPEAFAGGTMRIHRDLARAAIEPLAQRMSKSVLDTALGILRVTENNMGHAIRAVSSRRGLDPRRFALVSFGGAGGLHACALAESLEIPQVIVPPYCGVLSALGMVAAPAVADASRTVVQLKDLDDRRLAAEYAALAMETAQQVSEQFTESIETFADVRFRGQSHELRVRAAGPARDGIIATFLCEYESLYGHLPQGKEPEIVTLRLRRIGPRPDLKLPSLQAGGAEVYGNEVDLTDACGVTRRARPLTRGEVLAAGIVRGPVVLLDPDATTYVPPEWRGVASSSGTIVLTRS